MRKDTNHAQCRFSGNASSAPRNGSRLFHVVKRKNVLIHLPKVAFSMPKNGIALVRRTQSGIVGQTSRKVPNRRPAIQITRP